MIAAKDLGKVARARLSDAQALLAAKRFDGAIYLGGYAIEIALKLRICKALGWLGYPATKAEFQNYQTFRTHDLDVLLHLSGREARIKTGFFTEWSTVARWDPTVRYSPTGSATAAHAEAMLAAVETLVRKL